MRKQTAKLISAFVFTTQIVQSLYFLNTKFQASIHLMRLYSPVSVGPVRKPRRPVFSYINTIYGQSTWAYRINAYHISLIHRVYMIVRQNFKRLCYLHAKSSEPAHHQSYNMADLTFNMPTVSNFVRQLPSYT